MMSEKKFIPFNLNEYVRVKLNERGVQILRDSHECLRGFAPSIGEFKPPAVDAEGWSRFQAHEFMREFGPHMHMGPPPPFETTIEFEVDAT